MMILGLTYQNYPTIFKMLIRPIYPMPLRVVKYTWTGNLTFTLLTVDWIPFRQKLLWKGLYNQFRGMPMIRTRMNFVIGAIHIVVGSEQEEIRTINGLRGEDLTF
jgi:hypothetical protein